MFNAESKVQITGAVADSRARISRPPMTTTIVGSGARHSCRMRRSSQHLSDELSHGDSEFLLETVGVKYGCGTGEVWATRRRSRSKLVASKWTNDWHIGEINANGLTPGAPDFSLHQAV